MADTLNQAPVQQAPEPRSPWSLGKKVKAALLATAAAITSLWGAVKAIDEVPDKWEEWRTPASEMDRTPSLGLRVVQGESERPLLGTGTPDVVRVDMRRAPFRLLVTDVDEETAVQVLASTDSLPGDVQAGVAVGRPAFACAPGPRSTSHSTGKASTASS